MNEAPLRALLAAYVEATGLQVTLTYQRQMTLTMIHSMSIKPEDILMVANKLKQLIKQQTKGYSEASLDWRNFMGNPDILEERVLRCRQEQARKVKPKPQVQAERHTGNGTIRVLDDPKEPEPQVIDLKASLINLANNIRTA